jgi:hypothetical protein
VAPEVRSLVESWNMPPERCARTIKREVALAGTIAAMSATSDAFARFLDVLADPLDDHATSGDVLAERVHLSRFHFDRLVSAAAGEPPAAFRRRGCCSSVRPSGSSRPTMLDAGVSDLGSGDPMRWVAEPV